ncbi:hypothetical protein ZWY2020_055987 [Hordeum vulgare]|nr:hypothetical protein ZWY2020_055987 [Hordeum vulgare]
MMSLKAYAHADRPRWSTTASRGSLDDMVKRVRSQQSPHRHQNVITAGGQGSRQHFCNPGYRIATSSPMMLEEGFKPCQADCDVARLIDSGSPDPESSSSLYAAPECYQSSR